MNVALILCSDPHIREDIPICRDENFLKEQWLCLDEIASLQDTYDCPVLCAGDLFHHWKPSPWLLSKVMNHLPKEFYTIYGQHDLPQHNWKLRSKSGIHCLEAANVLKVLSGVHYGEKPEDFEKNISFQSNKSKILVWHHLTYLSAPFPGASSGMSQGILRKYPQYDLIVTGDNHQSFTIEYQGRRLVNPGNMTRQIADQADFKPRVYLWYPDNSVKEYFLPIMGKVSRAHIEEKEQRDKRIDAFISKIDDDWKANLSFEENLEEFFLVNEIDNETKQIIYNCLDPH